MEKLKTCFLISPIGEESTAVREYADKVRDFLRYEVMIGAGYDLRRADENLESSTITDAMINSIIESDLVIALLDFGNANVYYELAVRHGSGKVCFPILSDKNKADHDKRRPFDTQDVRDISFSYSEMMDYSMGSPLTKGLAKFKSDLTKAIKQYEKDKYEVLNPIIRARRDFKLPSRMTAKDLISQVDSRLTQFDQDLVKRLSDLESAVSKVQAEEIMKTMSDLYDKGVATYIEGETEAFDKLAEMTKMAQGSLRTSRFAPQAISGTKKDFFDALCDFGKKPGVICKRIMCMNESSKASDLWGTVFNTYGGSMELYLTKRDNNFELVVVDDIAAFLHFYDEERRIKSTLFIKGKSVIREFEKIYDRILQDKDYDFQVIKCAEFNSPNDFTEKVESMLKYFGMK